jgi:carotenoid 1,2-hydratase
VEVDFDSPCRRWSGNAYFDSNRGSEPLEAGFHGWNWSRWTLPDGVLLRYDVDRRAAAAHSLLLQMDGNGHVEPLAPPPPVGLPSSGWRIERRAQADSGTTPAVLRTLVDAPFYARSVLATDFQGRRITGVHESLSLDRFASRWVQALLPFRMPRRGGAPAVTRPTP